MQQTYTNHAYEGHSYPGNVQPQYGHQGHHGQHQPPPMPPGTVMSQPMPAPAPVHGCPPGLEYLTQVDQLVVKQVVELLEAFLNWESNNRYKVLNTLGQQVYFMQEETNCCERQMCGPHRGFVMHVTDNSNKEVMRIVRHFKCCAGNCWCARPDNCCSLELEVQAPVGEVVGYVKQECSSWRPRLGLYDAGNQMVGLLTGPCCVCNAPCCGDVEFPITDPSGVTEIGKCSKQWTGAIEEYFTDADNFSVKFPLDMDVRMKALYLGALMMVDIMYFEQNSANNH